jgi:hypothetical protein
MAVKARFWVQKITRQAVSKNNVQRIVELAPVIRGAGHPDGGDKDNLDWSKYTPSGNITLTVSADGAGEWFESMLGEDVAITFEAVTPAAE